MTGEIIFYQSEDGKVRLETRLENESLWLTINQMAEFFNVDKPGISRHLKNIFATGELQRQATVANFATVQNEGERSVERDPGLILRFVTRLVIDLNIYVLNPVSGKSKGLWLQNGTIQNFLTVRQEVSTAKPRGKMSIFKFIPRLAGQIVEFAMETL
jgi:hypothetical protein